MLPANCDAPIEIIITDEIVLSNMPKVKSCDCSLSISTADDEDIDSTIPQYIEMTPGNYYEIVESRWESEHGLIDESDKSPNCVSGAPWPSVDYDLGYASPDANHVTANESRPNRRGSLVMTLKRTCMHQEDITRRESVVSPTKPTIPFRRGSIVLSFEETPPSKTLHRTETSESAPIRPFRRASIVMNVAQPPVDSNKPKPPSRRGSLALSFVDTEYEVPKPKLQLAESQSSVPPKYPSRKASMDMSISTHQEATSKRRGSLVWTITPGQAAGEEEGTEHICLTVSGFSVQAVEGSPRNEKPKFPHRHQSMDMTTTGSSCA